MSVLTYKFLRAHVQAEPFRAVPSSDLQPGPARAMVPGFVEGAESPALSTWMTSASLRWTGVWNTTAPLRLELPEACWLC